MKGNKSSLRSLMKNVFGKSSSTSRVVMSSERAFSDKSTSPTHEDDASKETEEEENDNNEPSSEDDESNSEVKRSYYPMGWNIQQGPFKRSPVSLPAYPNTGSVGEKEKGQICDDEEKQDSGGESSSGDGCSHCGCSGCKGCVGGYLKYTGCGCGKGKSVV